MKQNTKWSMDQCLAPVRSLLSSQRGISVIIIVLLFFMVMMLWGLHTVESRYLQAGTAVVDDAVVGAGLAALTTSIETEIAYGEYALDKAEAERVFRTHLQRSLNLDEDLNPQQDSIIIGPVSIDSFVIYNPEEVVPGLHCPLGTPVKTTAIHVVLSFNLKRPALRGLFGDVFEVRIHRDVDNYYTLSNP